MIASPDELAVVRRAYAEKVASVAALTTPGLVEALAVVHREAFLPPGPWLVVGEGDAGRPPRQTADDHPRHVYEAVSVAIDPQRQLFNGSPVFLGRMIDLLALAPGARVLHIGAGLGYYSAIMARVVGSTGRVIAVEVDAALADKARANLAATPWVDVVSGDGRDAVGPIDAILVNAGVTQPEDAWLDALAPGGRLLLPLTVGIPGMGQSIGKGVMLIIERTPAGAYVPAVKSFVAIYSAVGLRDAASEAKLGAAMRRTAFPNLTRLRRDAHTASEACWLHGDGWCLTMESTE